jgi:acetoacetate decarboxylase
MRKADAQASVDADGGSELSGGPYRFVNREFLVISYETDPELIRASPPEPLEPLDQPVAHELTDAGQFRLRQLYQSGPVILRG